MERAIRIIREAWAITEMYYRQLVKHYNRGIQTLLRMRARGEARRGEDWLTRHRLSDYQTAQVSRR